VSRATIINALWDFAAVPDANTVDVLVRAVRVKLDQPFPSPLLHTVRGVGYLLQPADETAVHTSR